MYVLDSGGSVSSATSTIGNNSSGSLSYPGIIGIVVAVGIILLMAVVAVWLWYFRVKNGVVAVKNGDESNVVDDKAMHIIEMQEEGHFGEEATTIFM